MVAGSSLPMRPSPSPGRLNRRMLATDALFWYVEEAFPGFRSTIAALYILDRPPDKRLVRAVVRRALREIPRLRQKVVDAPYHLMPPEWVDDPHMDLRYHVRREAIASPGNEETLLEEVAANVATPLDRARPLWEMHVLEGLEKGRAAILFKTHHSMVDGVGAIAMFDSLSDATPKIRRPRASRAPAETAETHSPVSAMLRDTVSGTLAIARDWVLLWRNVLFEPRATLKRATSTLRGLSGLITDMGAHVITDPLATDATGMNRRLQMSSISMARLKRARGILGATINDMVLSAIAGAVGRYHAHRGVRVDALNAMVPMSLRTESERARLGNRVGMMNIRLPVGEPDAERRLEIIQSRTGAAKRDRRGAMYPFLNRVMILMPGFIFKKFMEQSATRVNLVCSNIPGIPEHRYFAGSSIECVIPYAPITEVAPLSVALLSYRDELGMGIATDPEAIPDPEKLRAMLADAFEEVFGIADRYEGRGHSRGKRAAGKRKARRRR